MPSDTPTKPYDIQGTPSQTGLPSIKPEDMAYFGSLLTEVKDEDLNPQEVKERKIMMLLLKIKNGTP